MSLLFRDRPASEARFYPSQGNTIPAPSAAGASPSYFYRTEDSFKIAAVVACVGLRAGAFAQLPIRAYRGDATEELSPQPDIVRRPSDRVVPSVWKTQMSISRDIWGWAAGLITAVDGAGYPSRVEWLLPGDDVSAREVGTGIEWRIGREVVDPARILHVPSRWVFPGRPLGISPLEYSGLVELAKRAQDYGRDWFRNGTVPAAILYSDTQLTDDQADKILARIKQRWTQRNPAVLGSGLKYEKVAVAANESQFLETMRQVAADIAVSFNLPPEKINAQVSGQSLTYANREQNTQQYLMDSINPDLVVVQEVLEAITPRPVRLRWKTGAFLRSDLKTRYESYQIGISSGILTPNEARSWEELPPLDGGDTAGGAA